MTHSGRLRCGWAVTRLVASAEIGWLNRDGAGRPGIGITWPEPPGGTPEAKPVVLVFDATTHEYLGTDSDAVTAKTFVDRAGQRP